MGKPIAGKRIEATNQLPTEKCTEKAIKTFSAINVLRREGKRPISERSSTDAKLEIPDYNSRSYVFGIHAISLELFSKGYTIM